MAREAAAVVGRADAEPAVKGAAHGLDRAEAAARATSSTGAACGLERDPRALHAQRLHVGGGRHAHLAAKARAKLRALMRARSASAGTERSAVEVVGDPRLQLAQRLALGGLRGELRR